MVNDARRGLASVGKTDDGCTRFSLAQVEIGVSTLGGAAQGSVLGYGLGVMNKSLEAQAATMPGAKPPMAQGSFSGPPKVLALNLAVFSAVQQGLTLAIKKYRGGVEDIQGSMMAMFGAGSALSLVGAATGSPSAAMGGEAPKDAAGVATDAVRTGALFALLNGAFMKVGQMFSGKDATQDYLYAHGTHMLTKLGLEKYEKNFRKGLLTDDTLMLLNDSALQEVRIPPGPRLKILNYVDAARAQAFRHQEQLSLAVPSQNAPDQPSP